MPRRRQPAEDYRLFLGEPLDPARSALMAKVRGKNTKIERSLRSAVWRRGGRFRLHVKDLPGTPDFANRRARVAVFVDGCFWHGCPHHATFPKTRQAYWRNKIRRNIQKRHEVKGAYPRNWTVIEVRECELKERPGVLVRRLVAALTSRGGGGRRRTG